MVGLGQVRVADLDRLILLRANSLTWPAQKDGRHAGQYQYILRYESIHLNFGIDVINQIKIENLDEGIPG